jgi:hypothetical protein
VTDAGAPNVDEPVAILAALGVLGVVDAATMPVRAAPPLLAWALANRLPDLEIDDVLALAQAADVTVCSTRF